MGFFQLFQVPFKRPHSCFPVFVLPYKPGIRPVIIDKFGILLPDLNQELPVFFIAGLIEKSQLCGRI